MTLVTGYETPVTQWDQDTTLQLNVASTSYIEGTPPVGVTFMAPTSGRVLLVIGGGARDNSGTADVLMAPEVYTGTQAIEANRVVTTGNRHAQFPGEVAPHYIYQSRATVVTGLAPLQIHFARLLYRASTGGSCDISVREIIIVPLP